MTDSVFSRFYTIMVNPGAAMEAVRENPRILVAVLGIVVLVGLVTGATLHIAGPEQVDLMRDTRFGRMMTPEQIEEAYDRALNTTVKDRFVNGIQGGIGTTLAAFIAGLVYFLFGKLAGGQGTFKQVIGAVMWSSVISMGFGSLVKWPLVIAKQSAMGVSLGPAVLVADRGYLDPLFGLLQFFDVFTIWGVIVLVIGFEKVHGFARNKAATVVVATWLLLSLIMFGLGRLFI